MSDYQESVTINRPKEEVFKTIANPVNATLMFVNVTEVETLNDKELEVGAKYREYRQLTNRRVGTDIEILDIEAPNRYQLKSSSNGLHVIYEYIFKDAGDGKTEVVFAGNVRPERLMLKLTKPLLVKMLKREDKDHLYHVKKYLEQE